jgi:1,2-diacylglycerol 3-alpha-glucosyltransferase
MATIGIFSECYRPMLNGVVTSVVTFAEQLRRLGFEIYIIAPGHPQAPAHEDHVIRFPYIRPPYGPLYPLAMPWAAPRLRARVARIEFDLIHSNSLFMMGRLAMRIARRQGVPLCFTYHTLIESYVHYVRLPAVMVRWAARRVSRQYANRVDRVVVPSHKGAEVLRRYGVARPIEVIPTGIDLSFARPEHLRPIRGELGVPAGAPMLVYAGRLAREKNIEFLLEAFALVHRRRPEAWLLLVGGGPLADECRALAVALGIESRVRFAGYVPHADVFRACAEANAFLFASHTETQGLVVAEAMSVGAPCVACSDPAVEDVVQHEYNGLIVNDDREQFAAAVVRLLDDRALRDRLGENARKTAASLSAEVCAARLAAVYRELMA